MGSTSGNGGLGCLAQRPSQALSYCLALCSRFHRWEGLRVGLQRGRPDVTRLPRQNSGRPACASTYGQHQNTVYVLTVPAKFVHVCAVAQGYDEPVV